LVGCGAFGGCDFGTWFQLGMEEQMKQGNAVPKRSHPRSSGLCSGLSFILDRLFL